MLILKFEKQKASINRGEKARRMHSQYGVSEYYEKKKKANDVLEQSVVASVQLVWTILRIFLHNCKCPKSLS